MGDLGQGSTAPIPRGGKDPATAETGTGVGEDHLHELNGVNYTRF